MEKHICNLCREEHLIFMLLVFFNLTRSFTSPLFYLTGAASYGKCFIYILVSSRQCVLEIIVEVCHHAGSADE